MWESLTRDRDGETGFHVERGSFPVSPRSTSQKYDFTSSSNVFCEAEPHGSWECEISACFTSFYIGGAHHCRICGRTICDDHHQSQVAIMASKLPIVDSSCVAASSQRNLCYVPVVSNTVTLSRVCTLCCDVYVDDPGTNPAEAAPTPVGPVSAATASEDGDIVVDIEFENSDGAEECSNISTPTTLPPTAAAATTTATTTAAASGDEEAAAAVVQLIINEEATATTTANLAAESTSASAGKHQELPQQQESSSAMKGEGLPENEEPENGSGNNSAENWLGDVDFMKKVKELMDQERISRQEQVRARRGKGKDGEPTQSIGASSSLSQSFSSSRCGSQDEKHSREGIRGVDTSESPSPPPLQQELAPAEPSSQPQPLRGILRDTSKSSVGSSVVTINSSFPRHRGPNAGGGGGGGASSDNSSHRRQQGKSSKRDYERLRRKEEDYYQQHRYMSKHQIAQHNEAMARRNHAPPSPSSAVRMYTGGAEPLRGYSGVGGKNCYRVRIDGSSSKDENDHPSDKAINNKNNSKHVPPATLSRNDTASTARSTMSGSGGGGTTTTTAAGSAAKPIGRRISHKLMKAFSLGGNSSSSSKSKDAAITTTSGAYTNGNINSDKSNYDAITLEEQRWITEGLLETAQQKQLKQQKRQEKREKRERKQEQQENQSSQEPRRKVIFQSTEADLSLPAGGPTATANAAPITGTGSGSAEATSLSSPTSVFYRPTRSTSYSLKF